MRRIHIILAAVITLSFGGAFTVSAQSGGVNDPLIAGNGLINLEATTTADSGDTYFIKLGNGYTGTTTGLFFYMSGYVAAGSQHGWRMDLLGYSGSDYTNGAGGSPSDCEYFGDINAGTSTQQIYGLVQTNNFGSSTACVMQPDKYYVIDLEGNVTPGFAGNSGTIFWGGQSSSHNYQCDYRVLNNGVPCDLPAPYFALVGKGFQLIPNSQSSGIFFSGAVDYCNSAFASTTGIGGYIGNGLCISLGFLFIPTADSIQQFQHIPVALEGTPPISWFTQMAGILQSANASSSENFVNVVIDFGTTTQKIGIQKLTVISTSTISKYLSDSNRNAFKSLLAVIFFVSAAGTIYWQLKHIWKTT